MKDTSRAERRYHKQHMRDKAADLFPYKGGEKLGDNLASCSCWMCGNPRRHFGKLTLQELRAPDVDEEY